MVDYILMPQKGLTEESAILSAWHVKKDDVVKPGDYLFDVETGKAIFSIESEVAGTILETIGDEGDEILVKSVVCVIGQHGESYASLTAASPAIDAAAPVAMASAVPAAVHAVPAALHFGTAARDTGDRVFVSPKAKALASEQEIDLTTLIPTGPNGRVIRDDVLRAVAAKINLDASARSVRRQERWRQRHLQADRG